MEKTLPAPLAQRPAPRRRVRLLQLALIVQAAVLLYPLSLYLQWSPTRSQNVPINARTIVAQCKSLQLTPGPPDDFYSRGQSDRFEAGTKPTLIRNATIWTGGDDGAQVVHGDILLDKGIIQKVGSVDVQTLSAETVVVDAAGAWVSPGIVDLHSHLGVDSAPALSGASDTNSIKGLVLPWLRSLDGLNTHDDAYKLSISGGVTTANVLPGSADAIGGQAFTIKLRPTSQRSSTAMLLEPPYTLNGTVVDPFQRPRWRQMKHACGENPSRVYSGTRMDTAWAFRNAYETARLVKEEQDTYCEKALAGQWTGLGKFPESLQWESMVDTLRGRVKVHNHCYEAVDLSNQVRLTNEFKFSIAAFHHAHEAYLVPDLLKQAYGKTPAIAIFATSGRYKREAFRGSEYAARILADNDIEVVMKSDHPVLNSRHLLFEAQQAHHFGLAANLALASVTSTPARIMGMDHRIGRLIEGYDADVVIWDSHPLALGAAPKQVFVDGIAQISEPHVSMKPKSAQDVPSAPNWDKETAETIKYEGLPPLEPGVNVVKDAVLFTNVGSVFLKNSETGAIAEVYSASATGENVVLVQDGSIVCTGTCVEVLAAAPAELVQIDLEGGSIHPALVSFGSPMGLTHITAESSTSDGSALDPLSGSIPKIISDTVIKAADGLLFASRDAYLAYRNGITSAIVAPSARGFLGGLSTVFGTAAPHKLADGAALQDVAALHVTVSLNSRVGVSTQIAALRGLLFGEGKGQVNERFLEVVKGELPLVVEAESADIIASLLVLKQEVEALSKRSLRLVIAGGTEAHLLATELAAAGVGVLTAQRPFPGSWQERRILPGPPLTAESAIAKLVKSNVTVGLRPLGEPSTVRNTRFDLAWAGLESNGVLDKAKTLALGSSNIEALLGVKGSGVNTDLVATRGPSELESKVVAVISQRTKSVDLL
uniref:Carbohydrate esterase family 9 protein n=1 Tax=Mycena chlorophos TaxID=658473 RepID=A0ABQ0LG41_MYCCL|nr:carbohydrate esterase family 9 protein [Mycena chlorophos]